MKINGYELRGGGACPEQYDVYKDNKQVGYLRLRHGWFRADYPQICHSGGETIYQAWPKGDGAFENDEREYYLTEAINAIDAEIKKEYDSDFNQHTDKGTV